MVTDLVSAEELKLIAPLGCGLMAGAGSVCTEVKAGAESVVLVTGFGAVGSGAFMAAKIAGCSKVIVVDRIASGLELAKSWVPSLFLTRISLTTGCQSSKL